jgi:predicted TIM-barrel fold metal-dependent hydrolase
MNVEAPRSSFGQRTTSLLVDCDIHPRPRSLDDLRPYLSQRWWDYIHTYGLRRRHGYAKGHPYPKSAPGDGMRLDAWPDNGLSPGADLDFMRAQHLDAYGVTHGIMNPLGPSGQGDQNRELSIAMTSATNHWQLASWADPEPRLHPSIVVPYEDGEASAAEIHRCCAADKRFVQVLLLSRTAEALGRRRYWPIYRAAVEHGLPVGIHVFGYSGYPVTNTGWASYYIEEMAEHGTACSALLTSMVMEGLFEEFRELRIVMIEAGFAWLPSLGWRLDKLWRQMRDEVPHLRRAPSEYLREHVWISTQPMEEPEQRAFLGDIVDWIGEDRILIASDYPHWDFDDPRFAFPPTLGEQRRRKILGANGAALYGLS